jgi:type II secretory ATPase GspE/PulE/Tfp pilus assembly ATPase PilB-like protein
MDTSYTDQQQQQGPHALGPAHAPGPDSAALPKDTALFSKAILLECSPDGTFTVAMVEPDRSQAFEAVRRALGAQRSQIVKRKIGEEEFQELFTTIYQRPEESSALGDWISSGPDDGLDYEEVEEVDEEWVAKTGSSERRDKIMSICAKSVEIRASDLHLRPAGKYGVFCPRIDGSLLPPERCIKYSQDEFDKLTRALISKVGLSYSDVQLHGGDAKFYMRVNGRTIQVRVSFAPTISGISSCLRFNDFKISNIDDLGLEPEQSARLRYGMRGRRGMVLFVGPTGSGKSVAQQAALAEADKENLAIFEIGQPIENRVFGRIQIEVDDNHVTWLGACKRGLRHDPDILVVGEIRDPEEAAEAFKGVTNGHLILSTLHVGSAAETPKRLLDLGIKSYQVAGGLNLVLSQRLIPKLCVKCKIRDARPGHEGEYLRKDGGCPDCLYMGTYERTPVAEVMLFSPQINNLITQQAQWDVIEAQSQAEGMLTMKEAAMLKIKRGIISVADAEQELGPLEQYKEMREAA